MERLFDEETLMMLFDELGIDFEEWISESNYDDSMTDQQIYALLPPDIIAMLGEFGINASWMHDGF